MAYKLIWSPAARDDLHDIVVFIARDNLHRAMSFGYELISETDRLQELPELCRLRETPHRWEKLRNYPRSCFQVKMQARLFTPSKHCKYEF